MFGFCELGSLVVEGGYGIFVGVTVAGLRVGKPEGGEGIPSIGGLVLIKGGSVGVTIGGSDMDLVGLVEGTAVVGLAEGSGPTLGEVVT